MFPVPSVVGRNREQCFTSNDNAKARQRRYLKPSFVGMKSSSRVCVPEGSSAAVKEGSLIKLASAFEGHFRAHLSNRFIKSSQQLFQPAIARDAAIRIKNADEISHVCLGRSEKNIHEVCVRPWLIDAGYDTTRSGRYCRPQRCFRI